MAPRIDAAKGPSDLLMPLARPPTEVEQIALRLHDQIISRDH